MGRGGVSSACGSMVCHALVSTVLPNYVSPELAEDFMSTSSSLSGTAVKQKA